jgi:tRNA (guanine-N(7)-)-methyltransferase subunit TRM82
MLHPFQKLAYHKHEGRPESEFLFTACGPQIAVLSAQNGSAISAWPDVERMEDHREPPEKRRKTEPNGSVPTPNVIELEVSADGQYLVAVTGEDKAVHVFSLDHEGNLTHLNSRSDWPKVFGQNLLTRDRCMPKRPSAIALTPDNGILVADKFGDVYLLPLIMDPAEEAAFLEASQSNEQSGKRYKPSATTLTVHSKRNLESLKQQMERSDEPVKTKESLRFVHKLQLGHVSMLTDILFARRATDSGYRDYILTCDRDEHIRVSRGPPQAHIIEHYCLGHTRVVTRMCLATPEILISGGADEHLCVWKWQEGRLISRLDISQHFRVDAQNGQPGSVAIDVSGAGTGNELIVSGLWSVLDKRQDAKSVRHESTLCTTLLTSSVTYSRRMRRSSNAWLHQGQ